ncbi:MAG: hypothetical protein ACOCUU_03370 [Nanoarchaeota archaeon]
MPEESENNKQESQGKKIGEVSHYFKHVKAAAIKLSDSLKVGDEIEIVGGERDVKMKVDSMEMNREKIENAKAGDEIGILVPEDVHEGYRVYLLE